jgi:hypothetical protein
MGRTSSCVGSSIAGFRIRSVPSGLGWIGSVAHSPDTLPLSWEGGKQASGDVGPEGEHWRNADCDCRVSEQARILVLP